MTHQEELRKQTEKLFAMLPDCYVKDFDDLLTKVYLTGYNNGIRHMKEMK